MRCAFCLKALPHTSHLNGFSPVCVLKCTLILLLFRNPLLQMEHLCTGFSLPPIRPDSVPYGSAVAPVPGLFFDGF